MDFDLVSRLAIARRVWERQEVKVAIAIWGFVCTYDTALSQIIPESLGNKLPKVRDAIAMSSGFLPFWAWLLILAVILIAASLEYAVRRAAMAVYAEPPDRIQKTSDSKKPPTTKATTSPGIKTSDQGTTAIATSMYREDWEKLDLRLDVLYRIEGNKILLKYSPDTKESKADALLLILFGYKKILSLDEVSYSVANTALASVPALSGEHSSIFLIGNLANPLSAVTVARDSLGSELVERIALSTGGKLRITATGYRRAYVLADDLIRRG